MRTHREIQWNKHAQQEWYFLDEEYVYSENLLRLGDSWCDNQACWYRRQLFCLSFKSLYSWPLDRIGIVNVFCSYIGINDPVIDHGNKCCGDVKANIVIRSRTKRARNTCCFVNESG